MLTPLLESGAPMVTLPCLGKALARGNVEPGMVCITFEGDFACWVPSLRWLLERGGRATLFALGAGVSQQPGLPAEVVEPLRHIRRISPGDMTSLAANGLAMGTLGMTGRPLPGLTPEQLRVELFDARRVLVEAMGCPVECLAYPGGAHSVTVVHAAASVGYRWGCTRQGGYVRPGEHALLLPRLEADTAEHVGELMRGEGNLYYEAVGKIRRARQRISFRGK